MCNIARFRGRIHPSFEQTTKQGKIVKKVACRETGDSSNVREGIESHRKASFKIKGKKKAVKKGDGVALYRSSGIGENKRLS